MESAPALKWWPKAQLQAHPIRKVVACGRQLNPPLFSQVVNFPRIELPVRGVYENQIEVNGQVASVSLRPGMALFAAPNCWNLPEWRAGLELLCLHFGRTQLAVSLLSSPLSEGRPRVASRKHSLPRPLTGPLPPLISALVELQATESPPETLADVTRAVLRCVEELLRQPVRQNVSKAQALLEDIRVYLQSHYQYDISRDSVAAQFKISPNHLSRLFQTHGNMTFSSYLTHVRIDRAKHLLRNYNLKLDDVAARCGYHDTPYFCHVFKNVTKCTPMEYRLNHHRPGATAA
jgi:AraC-like DNA-binding protein